MDATAVLHKTVDVLEHELAATNEVLKNARDSLQGREKTLRSFLPLCERGLTF